MSRNAELRERLLAGEHFTSQQVQDEYGGSRSGLQWALRTMKKEGHKFKTRKVDGNAQEYWLVKQKAAATAAETEPVLDLTDDRPTVVKLRERLTAGEGLVAAEIAEEYDTSPNTLSVTLAQMTKEGYDFESSPERTVDANGKPKTLKRHRVVDKHEPMVVNHNHNGRKKKSAVGFRIPAPQVDAHTEITLVHRISDGEIQIGLLQGGHQWLLEVKSYVE